MKKSFTHWQFQIFFLAWMAYAVAYFGRYNLSVVIPTIQLEYAISTAQIGILGSLFFWTYGLGQLFNGYIGDLVSSRFLVSCGLVIVAVTNLGMGFAGTLTAMKFLWGLNGFAQSMLWGPLVKTLSHWFSQKYSNRVSVAISSSMVFGYILAWYGSGLILANLHWKWIFRIPGVTIGLFVCVWAAGMRDFPADAGFPDSGGGPGASGRSRRIAHKPLVPFRRLFVETKLYFIVIASMAQGIIKDSISLWGPVFLMETQGIDMKASTQLIMFIPFMNFAGMLLAAWLNKRCRNNEKISLILLFVLCLFSMAGLLMMGTASPLVGVLFLGTASASMFGAHTLLLATIPMKYVKYNSASTVAGFLDSISYLSVGLASSLIGVMLRQWGWNGILLAWGGVLIAGILSLTVGARSSASEKAAIVTP